MKVGKEAVKLRFQQATLGTCSRDGSFEKLEVQLLLNTLEGRLRDITPEEQKALYIENY